MVLHRLILATIFLFCLPLIAQALATEHFGKQAFHAVQWSLPAEVDGFANLPTRVYWREVNGWPVFFYRGDVAAANEAMAQFAKLKTDNKHIRLKVGPGEAKDLQQKITIAFDWNISVPNGFVKIGEEYPAVMEVQITVPLPTIKVDEVAVKQHIADLDSPMFTVRDAANKKLREMGFAVVTHLQATLKTTESTEVRSRVETLLERLKGIDLQRLTLPKDIRVIGPTDIFTETVKRLSSANYHQRGQAVHALASTQADPAEIRKEIEKLLETEKNEYVLRCASSAVSVLGADAKPMLPTLKKFVSYPDVNVNQAYVKLIQAIEAAKPVERSAEEMKQFLTLRRDIQTVVERRGKPLAKP